MTTFFLLHMVFYAKFCEESEFDNKNCLRQVLYPVHGEKPRWRQDFSIFSRKLIFFNFFTIEYGVNIYHMLRKSLVELCDVFLITMEISKIQDGHQKTNIGRN